MELDAKIYIKTPPNWDPRKSEGWDGVGYDPKIGSRFLAGKAGSSIKIHGRKMERTWSLLAQNANGWSIYKKFIAIIKFQEMVIQPYFSGTRIALKARR